MLKPSELQNKLVETIQDFEHLLVNVNTIKNNLTDVIISANYHLDSQYMEYDELVLHLNDVEETITKTLLQTIDLFREIKKELGINKNT